MATYYSAFFSSGLLASHSETCTLDPYSPSTPRVAPARLYGQDTDVTPTAQSVASTSTTSNTLPSITETTASPTSDRPRLRRRRSSITTSASPLSALKSSSATPRTATASLQRLNLYTTSPTAARSRSRSGSVTDNFVGRTSVTSNEATHSNSLVGRIRSGSVGNSLRPRRTASRRVASAAPAPPPPTAPLPALPIPIAPSSSSSSCAPSTPRRPLSRRSQPSDNHNLMIPINTPPAPRSLSPFLSDDYTMPSSPLSGQGVGIASGLAVCTTLGGFDYPSPVDTPGERFVAGYFPPFDSDMKEN